MILCFTNKIRFFTFSKPDFFNIIDFIHFFRSPIKLLLHNPNRFLIRFNLYEYFISKSTNIGLV
jgi:hypothetical protein